MFEFDPTKGTEENLALFWDHLNTLSPSLATLLKENVSALIPLPSKDNQKSEQRVLINGKIAAALDQVVEAEERDP